MALGLPEGLCWQRICLQCRKPGFDPWIGKITWRREWLPAPVIWPGESHGQRSLAGYCPWGHKDMTEWLTTFTTWQAVVAEMGRRELILNVFWRKNHPKTWGNKGTGVIRLITRYLSKWVVRRARRSWIWCLQLGEEVGWGFVCGYTVSSHWNQSPGFLVLKTVTINFPFSQPG